MKTSGREDFHACIPDEHPSLAPMAATLRTSPSQVMTTQGRCNSHEDARTVVLSSDTSCLCSRPLLVHDPRQDLSSRKHHLISQGKSSFIHSFIHSFIRAQCLFAGCVLFWERSCTTDAVPCLCRGCNLEFGQNANDDSLQNGSKST